jgi:hypothetical protein
MSESIFVNHPDTRLTSQHPRRRREEGVVAVIRHDAVDILGAQGLGVMLKDLLWCVCVGIGVLRRWYVLC